MKYFEQVNIPKHSGFYVYNANGIKYNYGSFSDAVNFCRLNPNAAIKINDHPVFVIWIKTPGTFGPVPETLIKSVDFKTAKDLITPYATERYLAVSLELNEVLYEYIKCTAIDGDDVFTGLEYAYDYGLMNIDNEDALCSVSTNIHISTNAVVPGSINFDVYDCTMNYSYNFVNASITPINNFVGTGVDFVQLFDNENMERIGIPYSVWKATKDTKHEFIKNCPVRDCLGNKVGISMKFTGVLSSYLLNGNADIESCDANSITVCIGYGDEPAKSTVIGFATKDDLRYYRTYILGHCKDLPVSDDIKMIDKFFRTEDVYETK